MPNLGATWKAVPISPFWAILGNAAAQITDLMPYGNGTVVVAATNSAIAQFILDPADWGNIGKVKIRGWVSTNAVAPGVTFTFNLKPVATSGGASGATPTVASLGAAVVSAGIASPSADTVTSVDSSGAAFPARGAYVMSFSTSGALPANCQAVMQAALYRQ